MHRMPGLDLLRALAVVWVMLFHSYIVGGLGERFELLQGYGWMGVDLFFVLSGYLIGRQVLAPLARGERFAFAAFYRRRAFRILPAYLAVLAVYVAWPALREAPGLSPAWQFISFTLNLLIDYAHAPAFSHAWSLCVEEHFYLLFPLLAAGLAKRPSARTVLAVCAGVVVFGLAWRGYVWLHAMAPLQETDPRGFGLCFVQGIYYPTGARLDGLLAGVLLALAETWRPQAWTRWRMRSGVLALAGLAATGLAMVLFRDRLGLWPSLIGYPLLSGALALLVAAAALAGTGHWRVPGAGWLARLSYSLYLSHKLAMHAVATWLVEPLGLHGAAAFACHAAGVLAAGAALHYAVERPFLRWHDRADRPALATLPAAAP
ncbi:acyltransferase [Frateuria sp. Soil773]|uniref:acyltransferase family protein n=1 Tax=Frateuria sp. Soil773 TaxID=1736407 RepID=UPI0006F38C6B|nr:acyltransferase [Frateuria sp. Soil773]KRF02184.1 acyltransferase [Frateuria sp. Soil773]